MAGWLDPSELRIGLGCMRLSTDDDRDEERALATIAAAVAAGITVFDTARSYGRGPAELGHNERIVAQALRRAGAGATARIVTKGGMTRTDGAWVADGRARSIRADCEASREALDGLEIDLYLLHAPDPRTPWRTSVRALVRLLDEGLVRRIGVANVNRAQLDDALAIAPITAVQIALNPYDDKALRGGMLDRCADAGLTVIAHSPLGGPKRSPRLARNETLAEIGVVHDAGAAEVALAWLLGLSRDLVAIPGARRPETARAAARGASLRLSAEEREQIDASFGHTARRTMPAPSPGEGAGDVVLVMGVPGAGKTRMAEAYVSSGYLRLNRDERGGTLKRLTAELDDALSSGARRVVLDNTYLTRALRNDVLRVGDRHGVPTRCVWIDVPLAQAQVNLVERLLDRFHDLPAPEELKELARREPGVMAPTSQMRALRELEPPAGDEGFTTIEHVQFVRKAWKGRAQGGVFVAAAAIGSGWEQARGEEHGASPHLVFDWRPGGSPSELDELVAAVGAKVSGQIEGALCPHPGGPPTCWCRPPLPGLPLAFARRHGIDPSRSIVVGTSPAHRTLANALVARYVSV